jgi:membrane protease YdiL (CAAX protease family)
MAPISEEIFFRGFLFGGLSRYMSFLPAGLLSGIIFASAHAQSGLIIPFTIVGMILAATYRRTGMIYTSMGVHFLFNAISFTALVLTR